MDDGPACGRPFQDAAAVLVDPEDEPDVVEVFDADPDDEPEPDESEEDDDDADEEGSVFFSPDPLSLELPSFADDDLALAGSRLSFR
ncbi:MAG TPA: hypothetical protein VI357_02775 [Mycobacteriales bacterium]